MRLEAQQRPGAADDARQIARDFGQTIAATTLRGIRDGLQSQLVEESANRAELHARLERLGRPDRNLEAQIRKADESIAKLQRAVNEIDQKIVELTPTKTLASTRPAASFPALQSDPNIPQDMIISIIAIVFVGFPLALAVSRLIWRRASHGPSASPPAHVPDNTHRFDRLEQSVDAIAIEVERISENQRYLTKLLSEPRQNVPVSAGSSDSRG